MSQQIPVSITTQRCCMICHTPIKHEGTGEPIDYMHFSNVFLCYQCLIKQTAEWKLALTKPPTEWSEKDVINYLQVKGDEYLMHRVLPYRDLLRFAVAEISQYAHEHGISSIARRVIDEYEGLAGRSHAQDQA